MVSDTDSELPLWEITRPANVSENGMAIYLLKEVQQTLKLSPEVVSADANYDDEKILRLVVEDMQALPVIPQNPRRSAAVNYTMKRGKVHCAAGLEMYRKGKMRPKKTGILYC